MNYISVVICTDDARRVRVWSSMSQLHCLVAQTPPRLCIEVPRCTEEVNVPLQLQVRGVMNHAYDEAILLLLICKPEERFHDVPDIVGIRVDRVMYVQ